MLISISQKQPTLRDDHGVVIGGERGMRADEQPERIEGVRVPCRDAKRRVWQAMDLLERELSRERRIPQDRPGVRPNWEPATGESQDREEAGT